jgi:hypothetical protein
MSSESTGKFQAPGMLYKAFVEAVMVDVQKAVTLLGKAAFPNGPNAPPSPKVQILIDAGEWDAKEKTGLVGCSKQACRAKVGTKGDRFCLIKNCETIAAHLEDGNKLLVEEGWFVRAGLSDIHGAHVSPYLPRKAVDSRFSTVLIRLSKNPLKMTLGMWRLLCEDYHDGAAASMSGSEVDTKPAAELRKLPPSGVAFLPADAEEESSEGTDDPSPLTRQLLLATALTEGDPLTSPFAELTEHNPYSEAFLEAAGEEARTAGGISHGGCPLADPRRAGRITKKGSEGKLKTSGLEQRATALAGRPFCYYPWYQPGTVGILWLDLGLY